MRWQDRSFRFGLIYISPWWHWKIALFNPPWREDPFLGGWFGLFRNKPGVIKWIPGRLLPRRWGFYILGFEFGDRGS